MFEIETPRRMSNRSGGSPRWLPARLIATCILVAIGAATCSAAPKQKPDDDPSSDRPIRPASETDRERFDEALEALESGNFEEATRSFRLLRAEVSEDRSVAQLAELYVARAMLGTLESSASDDERQLPDKPVKMLGSLESDRSVDPTVRRAAQLYWAYAQMRNGARARATSALSGYPDGALGSAVLDRDRGVLWPVLAEGLHANGRWEQSLAASAGYYRWLASRRNDSPEGEETASKEAASSASDTGRQDESIEKGSTAAGERFDFARSRGFEAASQLAGEKLEARLDAEGTFVRATAGWAYLDRKLDSDPLGEKERKRIDRQFREVTTDLNAVGAPARISELSVELATLGGDKRLVIGAVLPLTGGDRSVGQRAISGMSLAMRAFQHRGPSRVTLVFEDSLGAPEATMQRLADAGASAVIGPIDRTRAAEFAAAATDREIPLISLTAKLPEPSDRTDPPFVVRNFMNPVEEARAAARVAFREYEDRRAAVAFPDVGYGRRVKTAFVETFRRLGGRVVATVSYDRGASDYSVPARQIAESNPDAVFIPDAASKVSEWAAFLANQDVWGYAGESGGRDADRTYVHYLGTSLWHEPIVTRQASKYLKGAVIPAWYASGFSDDATKRFGRRFRGVYDRAPSNIEAFAYDNVVWLRGLLRDRGLQEPEAVRDALLEGNEFRGATGLAKVRRDGRLRRTMRFLTVRDGDFRPMSLRVEVTGGTPDDPESDATERPSPSE